MKTTARRVRELGYLSPAERQVLEELDTGDFIVLGDGAVPAAEDESRRVRAGLIRLLLLGSDPEHQPHEKGVRIGGAWIPDELDLEGCRIPHDIALIGCRFDVTPVFESADLANLYLDKSKFPGFFADRLETRGGLYLRKITSTGEIQLRGAKLGGDFDSDGADFRAESTTGINPGFVLSADRLKAGGSMFLRGVKARGAVRLVGARLGGDLDCAPTQWGEKTGPSEFQVLFAAGLETPGNIFLRCVDAAKVDVMGAKLGGNLECDGAAFGAAANPRKNPEIALCADRLETGGSVFLRKAIGQETRQSRCFCAIGEVRLRRAKIGGSLDCSGATLVSGTDVTRRPGQALSADGLEVRGSIFLRSHVDESSGETDAFIACGGVVLPGIRVRGGLDCSGATFQMDTESETGAGCALFLNGAQVEGSFSLFDNTCGKSQVEGTLDLSSANFGTIVDREACWPAPSKLILDRCNYGSFTLGAPVDAETRLRWLGLQDLSQGFRPQPYEQCAKVLREMGHVEDARAVLIEKEKLQRAARLVRAPLEQHGWFRLRDRVLWHTVRHGRQPLRSVLWLAAFWAIGTVIFFGASDHGAIKPNNPVVLRGVEWVDCREGGEERGAYATQVACFLDQPKAASYPRFNALIYSADTLLPIVSLEMQGFWIPDESTPRGAFARVYLWVHIAVGWALSLLAVAGFSGLVKSD